MSLAGSTYGFKSESSIYELASFHKFTFQFWINFFSLSLSFILDLVTTDISFCTIAIPCKTMTVLLRVLLVRIGVYYIQKQISTIYKKLIMYRIQTSVCWVELTLGTKIFCSCAPRDLLSYVLTI